MRRLLLCLFTLVALSAMSQDMVLVGPRVRVSTDTLFIPVITDVDKLDLRSQVDSLLVQETLYSDQREWTNTRLYRFDSQGYLASLTLIPPDSTMGRTIRYTNTYRRGRLQKVEKEGASGDCSRLAYRYDLSGNVIGNVVDCADSSHILSTTVYDRFRNPLSCIDYDARTASSHAYRYDRSHPGQAVTSTGIMADLATGDTLYTSTRYIYTSQGYIARTVTTMSNHKTRTVNYIYDDNNHLIIRETVEGADRTVDTFTRDRRGSLLTHTQHLNGTLTLREEYSIYYH